MPTLLFPRWKIIFDYNATSTTFFVIAILPCRKVVFIYDATLHCLNFKQSRVASREYWHYTPSSESAGYHGEKDTEFLLSWISYSWWPINVANN